MTSQRVHTTNKWPPIKFSVYATVINLNYILSKWSVALCEQRHKFATLHWHVYFYRTTEALLRVGLWVRVGAPPPAEGLDDIDESAVVLHPAHCSARLLFLLFLSFNLNRAATTSPSSVTLNADTYWGVLSRIGELPELAVAAVL